MMPIFSSCHAPVLLCQEVREIEGFGAKYTDSTHIHPLGLCMAILACGLLLAAQRKYATWAFIFICCMVAPAQRVVIAGLDFDLLRILVICSALRIGMRREWAGLFMRRTDWFVIAFAIVRAIAYTIQQGSTDAVINQTGEVADVLGFYFAFRILVRSWDDAITYLSGYAWISMVVAVAFVVENATGHNGFAMFGGVPEITHIREGRLRCQGPFPHPIIAGCYWASIAPTVAALCWHRGRLRWLGVAGVCGTLVCVLLSASSTPVMGVIFGSFAGCMYVLRRHMRVVLWSAVALAVVLHMSMKMPIWHLISRITIAQGNTGYHRYKLIDSAIERFSEWALVGTRSTAHWFWGGQDVTNQFVLEAAKGGAFSLALFVCVIATSYRAVGRIWRSVERRSIFLTAIAWALGTTLFVHCTNFIGVSYFGQIIFLWYSQLAVVSSLDEICSRQHSPHRSATHSKV